MRNNAGAYAFAQDLFTKAEDFLILGTTAGTYYITEDLLTVDSADCLIQAIQADDTRVVQLITEMSTARRSRAPKNRVPLDPGSGTLPAAATGQAFCRRSARATDILDRPRCAAHWHPGYRGAVAQLRLVVLAGHDASRGRLRRASTSGG